MAEVDETHWPVSCKGVILTEGRVLLGANDRGEWELPGGRLEIGETPAACVAREVLEETGLAVEVQAIVDSWVYEPVPGRQVLIVTYGCHDLDGEPPLWPSHEHRDLRFIPIDELDHLVLPGGYRRSIVAWAERPRCDGTAG